MQSTLLVISFYEELQGSFVNCQGQNEKQPTGQSQPEEGGPGTGFIILSLENKNK